jgi:hypothetical protein
MSSSCNQYSHNYCLGLISALAFSPAYESPLLAAGSLTPSSRTTSNLFILSPETGTPLFSLGAGRPASATRGAPWEGGVPAGVSQLAFDPVRPHILYAAFRRHEGVYAWDLRGDVGVPVKVFRRAPQAGERMVKLTNQRMRFDVDLGGRWLSMGDMVSH